MSCPTWLVKNWEQSVSITRGVSKFQAMTFVRLVVRHVARNHVWKPRRVCGGEEFFSQDESGYSLPGHSKPPGRVYEPTRIDGKRTSYRKKDGQLSQCMNGAENHDSNQPVGNDEGGRAAKC